MRAHLAAAALVATALHLVVAALTDLAPDEAYYALWSRDLAVRYLDHPPAVAWVIAGARALAGDSALAVRLPALVAGAATPVLAGLAAERLAGPSAGAGAAWLAALTLFAHALGIVVTPDTPLTLAWAAALFLCCDLWRRPARPGGRLVLLGVACGAAILSKLTGIVLLAGAVAGLGWSRRGLGARLVLVPGIALALASPWIAAVVADPAGSDVAFQLRRFAAAPAPLRHAPAYLAGQVGLLTPALAWGAVAWILAAARRRASDDRLLLPLCLPLVLGFLAVSLVFRVEPNWPGPAWLAALVAMRPSPRLWRAAVFTSAPLVLAAHLFAVTGIPLLPDARDPTARLRGWSALGETLAPRCAALDGEGARVVTTHWGYAAEVLHYAPACAPVRLVAEGTSHLDRGPLPDWPQEGLVLHRPGRAPALPGRCRAGVAEPVGPSHLRLVAAPLRCTAPP